MQSINNLNVLNHIPYVGPAVIQKMSSEKRLFSVMFQNTSSICQATAIKDLANSLNVGDLVLAVLDSAGEVFITSLLSAKVPLSEKYQLSNGNVIELHGAADQVNQFNLRKSSGELMVSYNVETNKTILHVDSGDLDIHNTAGDINLNAKGNLNLCGKQVAIEGEQMVNLSVQNQNGIESSQFAIQNQKISFTSEQFFSEHKNHKTKADAISVVSDKYQQECEDYQLSSSLVSIDAKRILQKTKYFYTQVSELFQQTSKRCRNIVKQTAFFKAKKTLMRTEDDFKVRADQIHLG